MDILEEVLRAVKMQIETLKLLPFENDYKKGQLDMADLIKRLIEIMQNKEGVAIAENMELGEAPRG